MWGQLTKMLKLVHMFLGPLLYLYNCQTDPNENTNNEVVFSFWSVLRLLLGNNNNEVVFSFWSIPSCYRKRLKSAVICFQKDPSKAAIYWTS
jgi:hypothetical protein